MESLRYKCGLGSRLSADLNEIKVVQLTMFEGKAFHWKQQLTLASMLAEYISLLVSIDLCIEGG